MVLIIITLICALSVPATVFILGWFLSAPARYQFQIDKGELWLKEKAQSIDIEEKTIAIEEKRIKAIAEYNYRPGL